MTFVVIGVLILIGTIVQGAIGFGLGTLATPIIAILYPELLPTVILCLAFVISTTTMVRATVAWDAVLWLALARVPGTLLGVWAVATLSHDALALFIGFAVIFAMAMSGLGWSPKPTRGTFLVAGAAAGFLGTSTSIGGPPLALAMKRFDPGKVRGTMAITFVLGSALSLILLGVGGQISALQLKAAAAYLPVTIVGLIIARKVIPYIDSKILNQVVIVVATGAAIILIAESLVGIVGTR